MLPYNYHRRTQFLAGLNATDMRFDSYVSKSPDIAAYRSGEGAS
jgi:hypothetical protein